MMLDRHRVRNVAPFRTGTMKLTVAVSMKPRSQRLNVSEVVAGSGCRALLSTRLSRIAPAMT